MYESIFANAFSLLCSDILLGPLVRGLIQV